MPRTRNYVWRIANFTLIERENYAYEMLNYDFSLFARSQLTSTYCESVSSMH